MSDMSVKEFLEQNQKEIEEMIEFIAVNFNGKKGDKVLIALSYSVGRIINLSPDPEMMKYFFLQCLENALDNADEN